MSGRIEALLVVRNHELLDELMAPWKLFVPVEGHLGDVVTEEEKEEFLEWYKDKWQNLHDDDPELFDTWPDFLTTDKEPTFDEAYDEDEAPSYEEETYDYLRFKKDENGVWRHWVEWNYNPDGWWEGWWEIGDFQMGPFKTKDDASNRSSNARKGDITNLEELYFDVLIMDGKWIDVDGKVYDFIKDLPDDVGLVCIGMRDMK